MFDVQFARRQMIEQQVPGAFDKKVKAAASKAPSKKAAPKKAAATKAAPKKK